MVDRRLGRGLDFFLTRNEEKGQAPGEDPEARQETLTEGQIREVGIAQIEANPFQPRSEFPADELGALAESIRQSGVLQPILLREVDGRFQLIAGERRWRAAQQAGLERVPAIVRTVDDHQAAVLALVENLQRADLNAIEKAKAFARIQELTGAPQDEVARQVGLDRSTVANFVRLLRLPDGVRTHVANGSLSMGQARALLGLDDAEHIEAAADEAIRNHLTVRQVEELVRSFHESQPKAPELDDQGKPKRRAPKKEVWLQEIEQNLGRALEASVSVRYGRKRSRITIEVESKDEFERVYQRLKDGGPAAD